MVRTRRTGLTLGVGALALASACMSVPDPTAREPAPAPPTGPSSSGPPSDSPVADPPAPSGGDPVAVAAGDIACAPGMGATRTSCQHAATGQLARSLDPAVVLALGDLQYEAGTAAEFAASYDRTGWGALKELTRPAPGNHEYGDDDAAGYYGYFGALAGDPARGYYSYDVRGPDGSVRWHLIALNSECDELGADSISVGCGPRSAQVAWLLADLAANQGVCTLAYWHRPRFSSSPQHPSSRTYAAFWDALHRAGADVVLNGHAHTYERFAPQDPNGAADPRGVVQFTVGTGGRSHYAAGRPIANSVVRNDDSFGVLALTLRADGYDWRFVPTAGGTFTDTGSARCHAAG